MLNRRQAILSSTALIVSPRVTTTFTPGRISFSATKNHCVLHASGDPEVIARFFESLIRDLREFGGSREAILENQEFTFDFPTNWTPLVLCVQRDWHCFWSNCGHFYKELQQPIEVLLATLGSRPEEEDG